MNKRDFFYLLECILLFVLCCSEPRINDYNLMI